MRQLTFLLTFLTTLTFAQVDSDVIKKQAELTAKALLNDDYETLIKFTYPKVIELVGGRDKMISLIKKGKIEMGQQGISFDKVIIGKPSKTVIAGDEIHCLVPQTVYMKVPKGKLKSETQLLAVSRANGSNWFFIDAVSLNKDNIKRVLPNYNFDLVLPTKSEPIFVSD
ncbi:MAG TPA: hypothetical protein VFG46_20630 [Chryseolinea sp.]|nr:hypothetical protein [Chryseolinea sp.]